MQQGTSITAKVGFAHFFPWTHYREWRLTCAIFLYLHPDSDALTSETETSEHPERNSRQAQRMGNLQEADRMEDRSLYRIDGCLLNVGKQSLGEQRFKVDCK